MFPYKTPYSTENMWTCGTNSPLLTLSTWCLSKDHPPRLEGSSSNPCSSAVLFSHKIRLGQVSYSKPTETEKKTKIKSNILAEQTLN